MKNNNVNPRKILIYPSSSKIHTAYKSLISNPPEGYIFIMEKVSKRQKFINYLRNYRIAKKLYSLFIKIFKTIKILDLPNSTKEREDIDLIFSTGYIYNGKKPYVIDIIDNIYCLAGYNYNLFIHNIKKIEKSLLDSNCKRIICANKISSKFMRKYFSKNVLKKTVLVYPAIKPVGFGKKRLNKKFRILFMGSINNPRDFEFKGGQNTIEVFEKISRKYKNVELVIRSQVPQFFKERIQSNPKIILIERDMPYQEVINLYSSSDMLLCPSHVYFGLMTLLESMSFKLPIVALDTYATREFITNGFNGFIVKKSKKIKSYSHPSYPANVRAGEFLLEMRSIDETIIKKLAEKVEFLIKNPKLRRKMGENGRKLIETKFSINIREKKLKKIFDDAIR